MCSPARIRIVLFIVVLLASLFVKKDVKTAFLKTGKAIEGAYVVPPREAKFRS